MENCEGKTTIMFKQLERKTVVHRGEIGNSVMSNMVLYMLSFFLLPKGVLNISNFFGSIFFWQGDSEKKEYRLAKWSVVYHPKKPGWARYSRP
jgi:hypothetical protein